MVPLIDLNDNNGAIEVLPGSHRLYPTYRGSTIQGIYEEVSEEIKPYLKTLYLKAGEAVFFDQSIIHFSKANLSDKVRIVTNTYFTHRDATFRIAYWNHDYGSKVELFEEDDSFMTDFEQFGEELPTPQNWQKPGVWLITTFLISLAELNSRYGKKAEKSMVSRVLGKIFG